MTTYTVCPNCREKVKTEENKKYIDCPYCSFEFKIKEAELEPKKEKPKLSLGDLFGKK